MAWVIIMNGYDQKLHVSVIGVDWSGGYVWLVDGFSSLLYNVWDFTLIDAVTASCLLENGAYPHI